jgi:hypothetical protein
MADGDVCTIELTNLEISFRLRRSLNYALYHCRMPFIRNLVVTNTGPTRSDPFELGLSIPGYSGRWETRVGSLAPGEPLSIEAVPLRLNYQLLEGVEGRRYVDLVTDVDGEGVHAEEILILGFYEWPLDPGQRKTLACFVQPSHPLVYQIVADVDRRGESGTCGPPLDRVLEGDCANAGEQVLRVLYDTLSTDYNIRYTREAPSYEVDSQVVRPPHRLIPSPRRRTGAGTCIDLALLLASCLENLHLQPLILIVRQGDRGRLLHALVGCWNRVGQRFEPVLTDFETLEAALHREQLSVVDSTGLTTRWGTKLPYEDAQRVARGSLDASTFVFALDIAAARQTVPPLQLPVSPEAVAIIRGASRLARDEDSDTLETKHLLWSLLRNRSDDTKAILAAAGGGLGSVPMMVGISPPEADMSRRATMNYRRCLDDARLLAGDCGAGFVEEEHLLYAALLSQSREVDFVLESAGTDRSKVVREFLARHPWTADVERTICEVSRTVLPDEC